MDANKKPKPQTPCWFCNLWSVRVNCEPEDKITVKMVNKCKEFETNLNSTIALTIEQLEERYKL